MMFNVLPHLLGLLQLPQWWLRDYAIAIGSGSLSLGLFRNWFNLNGLSSPSTLITSGSLPQYVWI